MRDANQPEANLADVLIWAKETGARRDPILELEKIPARLGYADEEISLISADQSFFEKIIAPSPYGAVSRSNDLDKARSRGNSRARSLLRKYWEAQGSFIPADVRDSYTALTDALIEREGFVEKGADFSTSTHKCLFSLRARCRVTLQNLDQAEFDRVWKEASGEKRRSLRRAATLLSKLKLGHNLWPELAPLLPKAHLVLPGSADRAERILWESLPASFRQDAERIFEETLLPQSSLASWAKEQLQAGIPSSEINALIHAKTNERGRRPKNPESAKNGYKASLTWLARIFLREHGSFDGMTDVATLMSRERISAATDDQIQRSFASATLKDPDKSQTLKARLTGLQTLARHGLHSNEINEDINVLKVIYHDFIIEPKEMTEEAKAVCRTLKQRPDLAARLVNAPSSIAQKARQQIDEGNASQNRDLEDEGLRRFASAVMHAIQLSRPLRTSMLTSLRYKSHSKAVPGNISWIKQRSHAELSFAANEVKNSIALKVHLLDQDADLLWEWLNVHRPRFLKMRGLDDSPYVFPGNASPRLVKHGLTLPRGCLAPTTTLELWDLGHRQVGLGLPPHKLRHVIATLILAIEPGNWAKVASVLSDTEATVRKHYGMDSGAEASKAVRAALLSQHANLFETMQRRAA